MAHIASGRFEVPQDSFEDSAASTDAATHALDLKEVLPELFTGTDRMPRLLASVWRKAADEAMAETGGAYTLRGCVVEFLFNGLPEGAARAKLQNIRKAIVAGMKPAAVPLAAKKNAARDNSLKGLVLQMESGIGKLVREGLGENPGDDMVRLWAARAMHNLLHSAHKIPLLPEMMMLVEQADIGYVPFIDRETGVIAGSAAVIKSPVEPAHYNTGETMRQDLAVLFSAAVQLYYLRSKGQEGVIMLPVHAASLGDEAVADLYRSFLPRLAPEIGGSIMLQILGLPGERASTALVETIGQISNAVRCYIFETSVLVRQDRLAEFPVLHASGFSLAEQGVPQDVMAAQGRIYAFYYRNIGLKTYINSVSGGDALGFARECGFTYIAGTAIGALQKSAYPLQKTGII